MSDDRRDLRALHWDGTITAGNVLTAGAMMLALLVWGMRLEGRVEQTEARTARLEVQRIADDQATLVLREALSRMQADQTSMLRGLTRIEATLDRLNGGRTGPAGDYR